MTESDERKSHEPLWARFTLLFAIFVKCNLFPHKRRRKNGLYTPYNHTIFPKIRPSRSDFGSGRRGGAPRSESKFWWLPVAITHWFKPSPTVSSKHLAKLQFDYQCRVRAVSACMAFSGAMTHALPVGASPQTPICLSFFFILSFRFPSVKVDNPSKKD